MSCQCLNLLLESRAWRSRPSVGGAWSSFLPFAIPLSPQCSQLLVRTPGLSRGVYTCLLFCCHAWPLHEFPALASVKLWLPGSPTLKAWVSPHGKLSHECLSQRWQAPWFSILSSSTLCHVLPLVQISVDVSSLSSDGYWQLLLLWNLKSSESGQCSLSPWISPSAQTCTNKCELLPEELQGWGTIRGIQAFL